MNIGMLCDDLAKGWYPTNLVQNLVNKKGSQDSIHVYTFGTEHGEIDYFSITANLNSFLYPFTVTRAIIKDDIDVFHIQFEFVMCNHILGSLLMPLLLIFGRIAGSKMIVTHHGPIHEPGKLNQLSALSPYKILSFLMPIYFMIITQLLLLLSHRTIVHGEVFKERIHATYLVPKSRVTVIHHGVVNED